MAFKVQKFTEKPRVSVFVAQPDPKTFPSESRLFKPQYNTSSSSFLALDVDGKLNQSHIWDARAKLGGVSAGGTLFRLQVGSTPSPPESKKQLKITNEESTGSQFRRPSISSAVSATAEETPPARRLSALGATGGRRMSVQEMEEAAAARGPSKAEKYYQALLKAERKRNEGHEKAAWDEFISRSEAAAMKAYKAMVAAEQSEGSKTSRSDSNDSEKEESDEESSDDEPLPLVPYEGTMQIVVEIMVERAPGEQSLADDKSSTRSSETEPTTASSTSTPRLDLADELQALQEELGQDEEDEAESEGLPDGLSLGGNMDNIYSINDPRLALGIAGTVFFVPEVERYALGPSLPPPPPPSLLGRRRLHLKPRLPLEISNHRYEDEHPNLWPRRRLDGPTREEKRKFEETMCTHDFYAAATKSMTRLPKLKSASDFKVLKKQFGEMIDDEIKTSYAWRTKLKREFLERKEKEKKQKEDEEAAKLREKEEEEKSNEDGGSDAEASNDEGESLAGRGSVVQKSRKSIIRR